MFRRKIVRTPRRIAIGGSQRGFARSCLALNVDSVGVGGRRARVDERLGRVVVERSGRDGKHDEYSHMWLRDHCRCPECFHPITKQRLVDTFKIPRGIKPSSVQAQVEGLQVSWGAHESHYPWEWLELESSPPRQKRLWTSDISVSPPTVQYSDVMKSDSAVLEWLENVAVHGFCFVKGVPATPEETEQLIRRIAFIRETQYGAFWDFTADLAHGDTAYTNIALQAHTDTTYYSDPCGLQIFHMLSHTGGKGGESLLVDGFNAAERLRATHPEHFATLSRKTFLTHSAGDEDTKYVHRGRIIETDEEGMIVMVRYNNDDRSVLRGMGAKEMDKWYDALRAWNQLLTDSTSEYWFQLTPGTVVVIDNQRVMHGRAAFTGARRMCGAYIGGDDYKSRLESLREGVSASTERNLWDPVL